MNEARRPLAVITDDRFGRHDEELAVLQPLGVDIRVVSCRTPADVAEQCADADALLLNLAPLDASAIAALRRCRVVSRYGVGLDNVDVEACRARGIAVYNVTGYCDAEVAEHALGLLLALARGVVPRDRVVRDGGWSAPGRQVSVCGSTVGVLGFGGAGASFVRAVSALSPGRVLVWSPTISAERIRAQLCPSAVGLPELCPPGGHPAELCPPCGIVEPASFDEVLSRSDFLSVHLRLTPDTDGLLSDAAFARMKRGVLLVNTARGALVDSAALARALEAGTVAGAGLDVLDAEPPPAGHPLVGRPDVIITGHTAYRSVRSVAELKRRCAENAAKGLGLLP